MFNKYNTKTKFAFLMLIFFSFLSILWMLSLNNSLTFDDFTTLYNARYKSFGELFNFFPAKTYNDRPVGLMFIKVLNIMFGLNAQSYHIVFALIHFFNVYLVYKISFIIFKNTEGDIRIYSAIIAAAIFGIYPISLMTVSWISAVYDIMCCFFILLSAYFYLRAVESPKYEVFYAVISIIFFYISIRTKEMALTLPLILLIYEISCYLENKTKINIKWYLVTELLLMMLFVLLLFKGGIEEIKPDNPYYQSFNIINLLENAIKYLFLYFDWGNTGFMFTNYSMVSIFGVVFFVIILIYSIFLMLNKKDFSIFLSIICIGLSITVVLTMVNMQHRLYLYIPSVFIGITVSLFLNKIINHFKFKYPWELVLIILPLLYLINYTPGMTGYKMEWLNFCNQDALGIKQIQKLETPVENTNIYIKGASDSYNVFFYGPGNSIKLIFDNPTIITHLVDEFPVTPVKPYIFLDYSNNIISELQRDMTIDKLKITSVYPQNINESTIFNHDGSLNIGVVCNRINTNLKITINDVEMSTTIGADFISTVIPKEYLNKEQLIIKVKDIELGIETDEVVIELE